MALVRVAAIAVLAAMTLGGEAADYAPGGPTRTVTIPLEIVAGKVCWFDARTARVLDVVPAGMGGEHVVLEAESPARYLRDPRAHRADAPLPRDDTASAGGYMDDLVFARYEFGAEPSGRYVVWARVATPPGRSRFVDYVNGRPVGRFFEEENEEAQGWHWVKRGEADLRPGMNRLEIASFRAPFPKLDKLVLSRDAEWQPEEVGPPMHTEEVGGGLVETADVVIPGLRAVLAVHPAAREGVEVSMSRDGGRTWADADSGARRDPRPPDGDAAPVRVRLLVDPYTAGRGPIGPLALTAAVDPERCVVLEHGHTRMLVDGSNGGLFLLENMTTGEAVVSPGRARPLVSVDFKKAGEAAWTRVSPESVTQLIGVLDSTGRRWVQQVKSTEERTVAPESVVHGDNSLTVTYLFAPEGLGKARVQYVIEPGERETWRFAVTAECLEGPADVVAVTFPTLEHVRIGESGLDDRQLRLQSFGHETIHPGRAPLRDRRYLGGIVLPWTTVYDEDGGLYLGSHDPAATNTLFTSVAGGLTAEHFDMSTRKLEDLKPGEKQTWEYRLGAHPGAWHWGADRYREWFYGTHGEADYPEWMLTCDGWFNLQAENYKKHFRFSQLPDWLTTARATGLDWLQVWGQFSYDGGACCASFYALSPLYGGADGWKAAASEVTRRGGRLGGYFIFHDLDMLPLATEHFLGHFKRDEYPADTPWVDPDYLQRMRLISDPTGAIPPWPPPAEKIAEYRERIAEHQRLYAAGERARAIEWLTTCYVNDPEWWEYLRYWIVDKYAKEYGCNTVYIDVLGTGSAAESFDPRRGHNGDGGWGRGKMLLAKRVAESAREFNPEFGATMEGMGDLTGLYYASMCSGVYRGGRNVMRYTFPERIFIHGRTNPASGGTVVDRFLETYLEGMRFDIVGYPTAIEVCLLALQRQFTPWLYEARFRDTIGLTVPDPRVRARLLLKESEGMQGALVTVVNRERLEGVRLTVDEAETGPVQAAFSVGLSGAVAPLELAREGQRVTFAAPNELAATVLLVSRPSDDEPLWPVLMTRWTEPAAVEVTLLNLTGRRQSGACRIADLAYTEPFEGRTEAPRASELLTTREARYDVAPWQTQTVRFPMTSPHDLQWTVRARVEATASGGRTITREMYVTPQILDRSFEFRGNATDQAVDGSRSFELPPSDEGYQHRLQGMWLMPGHRYRLSVKMRRSGFDARVLGTRLSITAHSGAPPDKQHPVDRTLPNEWQTIKDEFETPPELIRAAIYLYNVTSPDSAWFDDLRVEDLGPVTPTAGGE